VSVDQSKPVTGSATCNNLSTTQLSLNAPLLTTPFALRQHRDGRSGPCVALHAGQSGRQNRVLLLYYVRHSSGGGDVFARFVCLFVNRISLKVMGGFSRIVQDK